MAYDPLAPGATFGYGAPQHATVYADGTPRQFRASEPPLRRSVSTDEANFARQRKNSKTKKDDGPKKPSKLALIRDAVIRDLNDFGGRRWVAPDPQLSRITVEERALADAARRTHSELAELQKSHEKLMKSGRDQADAQGQMDRHEMDLRYRQLVLERQQLEERRRQLAAKRDAVAKENDALARQREQDMREDRIRQQREQERTRFRPPVDLPTRDRLVQPYVGQMRGASTASPYRDLSRDPYFDPYSNLAHDPLAEQVPQLDDPLQSVYSKESLARHNVDNILGRRRTLSDSNRMANNPLNKFARKVDARLNPPSKPNIPVNPYLPKDDRLEFAMQRAAEQRERHLRESLIGKSLAEQEAMVREFRLRERLQRLSPEERERLLREQNAAHHRRSAAHLERDRQRMAEPYGDTLGGNRFGHGTGFDGRPVGLGLSGGYDPLREHHRRSHSPPFGHDPFNGPGDRFGSQRPTSTFPSLGRDGHAAFPSLSRQPSHPGLGSRGSSFDGFPTRSSGFGAGGLGHGGFTSGGLGDSGLGPSGFGSRGLGRGSGGLGMNGLSEHGPSSRGLGESGFGSGGLGGSGLGGAGLDSWRRMHDGDAARPNAMPGAFPSTSLSGTSGGIDNVFADLGLRNGATSGLAGLGSRTTTPGSGAAELVRGMGLSSSMVDPLPRSTSAPLGGAGSGHGRSASDGGHGVRFANSSPTPGLGDPRLSPNTARRETPGPVGEKSTSTHFGGDRPPSTSPFARSRQSSSDLFGAARGKESDEAMANRAHQQEIDRLVREARDAEAETAKLEREAAELDRQLAEAEKRGQGWPGSSAGKAPSPAPGSTAAPVEGKKGKKKGNGPGPAQEGGASGPAAPPTLAQAQATLAEVAAHSGLRAEDLELVTADEGAREAALSGMSKKQQDQLLERLSHLAPHELEAIRILEHTAPIGPPMSGQQGKKGRQDTGDSVPLAFPEPSVPPPTTTSKANSGKKSGERSNFQSTSAAAGFSPPSQPPIVPGSPLDDLRDITFGSAGNARFQDMGAAGRSSPQVGSLAFPEPRGPPPGLAPPPAGLPAVEPLAAPPTAPGQPNPPGQGKKKKKKGGAGGEGNVDAANEPAGTPPPSSDPPKVAKQPPPPQQKKGAAPNSPRPSIRSAEVFGQPDADLLRDYPVLPAGQGIPYKVERFIDHVLVVLPPPTEAMKAGDMKARHDATTAAVQKLIQTAVKLGANAIVEFRFGEARPGQPTCEGDAVVLVDEA